MGIPCHKPFKDQHFVKSKWFHITSLTKLGVLKSSDQYYKNQALPGYVLRISFPVIFKNSFKMSDCIDSWICFPLFCSLILQENSSHSLNQLNVKWFIFTPSDICSFSTKFSLAPFGIFLHSDWTLWKFLEVFVLVLIRRVITFSWEIHEN